MKESLNENTLFNTVAMLRKELQSLMLVVEGEDDYFALKGHPSTDLYLLPGQGGRENVLAAAQLAQERRIGGVRFLVDVDYDRQVRPDYEYPSNVVLSDNHDVFMDLLVIGSQTIDQVIAAHARSVERRDSVLISADLVRLDAVKLAAHIAALRIANDRRNLELRIRDFPIGALRVMPPDLREIATLAIRRSTTDLSVENLEACIIEELPSCLAAGHAAVGDHDFFRSLARVLAGHGVRVSGDALASSFLGAVRCTHLMSTTWYSEIETWAFSNDRSGFACPHAA